VKHGAPSGELMVLRRFGEEAPAPTESEKTRRDVSPAAGFFCLVVMFGALTLGSRSLAA